MSSKPAQENGVGPPAIGGLLRLAWQMHRDLLYERVATAGYEDVTPAQFTLIRWPGMQGQRPSDLAESVGLSKQAVNDLLGELERNGYIERHPDPQDGRARIVHLTARGQRLQRTAHDASRELEKAWAASVGESRFRGLRSTLETIVTKGLPAS